MKKLHGEQKLPSRNYSNCTAILWQLVENKALRILAPQLQLLQSPMTQNAKTPNTTATDVAAERVVTVSVGHGVPLGQDENCPLSNPSNWARIFDEATGGIEGEG